MASEYPHRYRLELRSSSSDEGAVRGELVVPAPPVSGEKVAVDLHMVPGVLTLRNCLAYSVDVSPDSDDTVQHECPTNIASVN